MFRFRLSFVLTRYLCTLVSLCSISSSKISSASQRVISKNEIAIKSWKRLSSRGILTFSYSYCFALSVCHWIMLLIIKDLSIFSYQLMIVKAFRAYIHWPFSSTHQIVRGASACISCISGWRAVVDEEGGRSLTESVAWTLGAVVRKKWTARTVVTSSQEKGKKYRAWQFGVHVWAHNLRIYDAQNKYFNITFLINDPTLNCSDLINITYLNLMKHKSN